MHPGRTAATPPFERERPRVARAVSMALATLALTGAVGAASLGTPSVTQGATAATSGAVATRTQNHSPGPPTQLRVEHRGDRPSIDETRPRYSWVLADEDRGELQSAYQILVATNLDRLSAQAADVWNSGRVDSANSTSVLHAGPPLDRDRSYVFQVRTWDKEGAVSAWSAPASFDVQPAQSDLVARFVWDSTQGQNDAVYLRREFDVPADLVEARLYVTAHDFYQVSLNGSAVGRGPAPANPYRGLLLQGYHITQLLSPGTSATLSAVAHWRGGGAGCGVLGSPAFLAQLTLVHADGSRTHVGSDESWRVLETTPFDESAPLRGPSFAMATSAEWFDARLEPVGWRQTGFDDSAWAPATVVEPGFVLCAQPVALDATDRYVAPAAIVELAPELHLVDFGEYGAGWPALLLHGLEPGRQVRMHYSDTLLNGRIVRERMSMTDNWDHYVARGGEELWEPARKYQGFRYIELEGLSQAPTPSRIAMRQVHTKLVRVGSFACSEPLLEQIYALSERTQRHCTQGVLVDCPDREQSQYLADAAIQGLNLAAFARDPGMLRKLLSDFEAAQPFSGLLFAKAPSNHAQLIPEWSLHFPTALWWEHLLHDSPEVLARHRATLVDLIASFEAYRSPVTGLLTGVPGNPLSDHPLDPYDESGPALMMQNCLFVNALDLGARVLAELDDTALAAEYTARASSLRIAIHARLHLANGRYRDSSNSTQTQPLSTAMALLLGIVPYFERTDAVQYVRQAGFGASTYGGWYFSEYLWRGGEIQHLIDLTLEPDRLWRRMLDEGATTAWEAWVPGGSQCHGFTAYPLRFLTAGLLGVEPLTPGFARFRVEPRLVTQLSFAAATLPSPRGSIEARWDKLPDGLELHLAVPVNAVAEVRLPVSGGSGRSVHEGSVLLWSGGSTIAEPAGVAVLSSAANSVLLEVGSGTYRFRTTDG
ncbi:MAG: family 78 glycoside hydrolase catalytic domain [Planctomycetota bacterium]